VAFLQHVVECAGGDQVVRGSRLIEQRRDLERVEKVRRAIALTLTGVQALRIRDRRCARNAKSRAGARARLWPGGYDRADRADSDAF